MRQRKIRRFRHRSNDRGYKNRINGSDQLGTSSFSNGRNINNFKPQQSAEKLAERYNSLAKEALSAGDKILSENYFQHAEHYARIVEIKNSTYNQNRINNNPQSKTPEDKATSNVELDQNKNIEQKE